MAGFYDLEFLETPPPAVQTECPVCLSVLRDPYQATCCGYSFCKTCIEKVKADQSSCPCCKAEEFDIFEDKRLRRSLYAFRVRCTNKKKGCEWEGELGQLEEHLNANPPSQVLEQLEGCQFVDIKCLYCINLYQRSHIQTHQSTECPRRPTMCMYCDKYCSNNEDVTVNHWSLCAYYPEHCPNKCGKILQRQNLAIHVSSACPLAEVDCDFKLAGCPVRTLRKEMKAHLDESIASHLTLLVSSHSTLQRTTSEQDQLLKTFELSNERLQQRTVKLNQALDAVKHNAAALQQKLSKRDEHLTQHLKSLQQQLSEETKRSKREIAKLVKMVKQQQLLLEEAKKANHKYPLPGVVVLVIVSVLLLYSVIQPLIGQLAAQCQHCNDCAINELLQSTLQPMNCTQSDNSSKHSVEFEADQLYCLPICSTNTKHYNVMFKVHTSTGNGKVVVDLLPGECSTLRNGDISENTSSDSEQTV